MFYNIKVLLHGNWVDAVTQRIFDNEDRIAIFLNNQFGPSMWVKIEYIKEA